MSVEKKIIRIATLDYRKKWIGGTFPERLRVHSIYGIAPTIQHILVLKIKDDR